MLYARPKFSTRDQGVTCQSYFFRNSDSSPDEPDTLSLE